VDGRQGDGVSARFVAAFVTLTLGVGLVTAACGSSSDSSTSTSASASATATATPAPARATSSGSQLTTVDLVEQLRPSVVHILSETSSFNVFGQVVPQQGVGTGIILDADGHIVTNNHVITDANGSPVDKITVTLSDNNQYQATIVGRDTPTDLAVLKITASSLTPAALGVSADLKVGQDVIAMGNALDLPGGPTVTTGVVSALNRLIQEGDYTIPDAIQTDAAINSGNSGGPLVDTFGEVIGITTAVIRGDTSTNAAAQGIGLAISIDSAKPIIQDLINNGKVQRGLLGVSFVQITDSLKAQLNLPVGQGVGLNSVQPGGPADLAGLTGGDIIVGMSGKTINTTGDLFAQLSLHKTGDTVSVDYYRGITKKTTQVTLG